MDMIFLRSDYLYFLLFIPIIIFTHYYFLRFNKKTGIPFANFDVLSRISSKYVFSQNNVQLLLHLLIITFLVLGLAGLGFYSNIFKRPNTIYFLVDASDSMMTNGNSSSLNEVKELLSSFPSSDLLLTKKGISTFSTISNVLTLPTSNIEKYYSTINEIKHHNIAGTDVGTAIINGISLLEGQIGGKRLVVITDGKGFFGTSASFVQQKAYDSKTTLDAIYVKNSTRTSMHDSLNKLVNFTGGEVLYTNESSVSEINSKLNYLENSYFLDLSAFLTVLSLVLLTLDWILSKTKFRVAPYDD